MSVIIEVLYEESDRDTVKELLSMILRTSSELNVKVQVLKRDIHSEDIISRYGILLSPTLVVNGIPMIIGRIPSKRELKDLLKRSILPI